MTPERCLMGWAESIEVAEEPRHHLHPCCCTACSRIVSQPATGRFSAAKGPTALWGTPLTSFSIATELRLHSSARHALVPRGRHSWTRSIGTVRGARSSRDGMIANCRRYTTFSGVLLNLAIATLSVGSSPATTQRFSGNAPTTPRRLLRSAIARPGYCSGAPVRGAHHDINLGETCRGVRCLSCLSVYESLGSCSGDGCTLGCKTAREETSCSRRIAAAWRS